MNAKRWYVVLWLSLGMVIAYTDRVNLTSAMPEIGKALNLDAEQQGMARRLGLERPPEAIVARPVDGCAQFAAPPSQAYATRRDALQGGLKALDGAFYTPRFPHGPQHPQSYRRELSLPMWTGSAMKPAPKDKTWPNHPS